MKIYREREREKSLNTIFANSTGAVFRNPFLYIFIENYKWICVLIHFGYCIPNSGTNEIRRVSTIICRSGIVAFYQKFMSEVCYKIYLQFENVLHYFWLYVLIMSRTHFREWIYTLFLPEYQGTPCSKKAQYLKFKWLQRDSNPQPLIS